MVVHHQFLKGVTGRFPLFVAVHVRRLNTRDAVDRRHFKPRLERAGLPTSTRLHDLRHTAATLLLGRGVHPKLEGLLEHATVAMTLDRYSHVLPSMSDQTALAMDPALS